MFMASPGAQHIRWVKYISTVLVQALHGKQVVRAKQKMLAFLKIACYRIEVANKIEMLQIRVSHVQFRFRMQVINSKTRRENIQKSFIDEAYAYQSELARSKIKENNELSKQFRNLNYDYGFKILEWYLKRCVQKHRMAFDQFMSQVKPVESKAQFEEAR